MQPFLGDIPETIQVVLEVYGKWSETPCEHEWTILSITQPTCMEIGEQSSVCLICGKKDIKTIEKLEHDYVNGVCVNKGCGLLEVNYGSVGLKFDLNDDEKSYSVSGIGVCSDFDIVIPETYNSMPVTAISDNAFSACKNLISIIISNSITSIGDFAFEDCYGLKSITIPNSVVSIGYRAFYNCRGLTNIAIPESITFISEAAFEWCISLNNVTIPNSVTSIGYKAFEYCSGLTSVTIGNSVSSIGVAALAGCEGLTSVTIGNSVTSIGGCAFEGCINLVEIKFNGTIDEWKSIETGFHWRYDVPGEVVFIEGEVKL